ncbi:hypothetical protein [Kushneria phosphatilytica]|uniref:Uncharacterized protein n=1 Tax=Kushneria phosphatilytica TaxID=657387 RepID=A0A5C1A0N5_9GAMM|nr:hypothetical protein [Kushneria phosphatilytica]QEL11971.1 hypothetical protein FY550_13045 [Kushneria phosphatilytica]
MYKVRVHDLDPFDERVLPVVSQQAFSGDMAGIRIQRRQPDRALLSAREAGPERAEFSKSEMTA